MFFTRFAISVVASRKQKFLEQIEIALLSYLYFSRVANKASMIYEWCMAILKTISLQACKVEHL